MYDNNVTFSDDVLSHVIAAHQSGGGSPQSQRPAELSDDEVGELFQRLAEVQQEKWMLEEKVGSPLLLWQLLQQTVET